MAEDQKDSEEPLSDLFDPTTLELIFRGIGANSNSTINAEDSKDLISGSGLDVSGTPGPEVEPTNGHRIPQSTMEVVVTNKMTRFRYDTELNNRNIGKEELVSIKFLNIYTEVFVRIHVIDPSNKKAHPYCLIGDKCKNGLYVEKFLPTTENKCTLSCKATIKIPKRGEYEDELAKRKQAMEKFMGIYSEDMKKAGYWNMNKNVKECKCVSLFVEAFYKVGKQTFMLSDTTHSLLNAKEGRSFSIHTIRPFAHSCLGSRSPNEYMLIVLTADSFIPKGIEVRFTDNEGWNVKAEKPNVIKNVLEVKIPPYKNLEIEVPKQIQVYVKSDGKVDLEAKPMDFLYTPDGKVVIESKKRKLQDYSNIPEDIVSEASAITKSRVKSHLEQRRKKMSKPSATATAPPPSAAAPMEGSLSDPTMSSAVYNTSAVDFLQNSPGTSAPYFPAVVVPSNVSFHSSTQPGYMETTSSQNSMLHENMAYTSNPSTNYQVPVSSAHVALSVPTPQINMPMQSLDNSMSARSLQSQYSLSSTMANSTVTSPQPPPSPMSNMGKFKTVAIAGTNQWLLIDQFGKPLLVLGGQNDEVSAVQDITSMPPNITSPSMYDQSNGMGFPMSNASDTLSINPLSNASDNDLEVDDAGGDSADHPSSSSEVKVSESSDVINSESRLSSSPGRETPQVAFDEDVINIGDDVDVAATSMEQMSLELKDI